MNWDPCEFDRKWLSDNALCQLGNKAAGRSVGSFASALDDVTRFIQSYVVLTSAQATAIALWVAHTYAFEAADATPYLSITSPEKRSGKTRLLEVLELLVYNPWLTGRATAAVLVRKIDAQRPTLLLDETDAAFKGNKDYAEALRGVLNSGHRRGGKASLCVGQGANIDFRDFTVFCPKAIAGIGSLPDTVADRSIQIILARKADSEVVSRFRRRDAILTARGLAESIAVWAAENIDALAVSRPSCPEDLNDRQHDGWEPLLAIADAAGGDWPDRARRSAVELSRYQDADDSSVSELLLAGIRSVFDERGEGRISSAVLVEELVAMEGAPWGEWTHGRPITCRGVARLLRSHRIQPRQLKIVGDNVRGYERAQFEQAFSRYVRRNAIDSATDATTEAQHGIAKAEPLLLPRSGSMVEDMADADGTRPVAQVADKIFDAEADDFVNEILGWRDRAVGRTPTFQIEASP